VLVNGQPVGQAVTVTPDALQPYSFAIPAAAIGDGQHVTLTLDYDATIVPAEAGQGDDQRRLAVAVDSLFFQPE
jgi:hypothetical protein